MTPILNFTSGLLTGVSGSSTSGSDTGARQYSFIDGICVGVSEIIPGVIKNTQNFTFIDGLLVGVSGSISGSTSGSGGGGESGSSISYTFCSDTDGWTTIYPTLYARHVTCALELGYNGASTADSWVANWKSGSIINTQVDINSMITWSFIGQPGGGDSLDFKPTLDIHYTDGGVLSISPPGGDNTSGTFVVGPTSLHSNVTNNILKYLIFRGGGDWYSGGHGYIDLLYVEMDGLLPI